MDALLPKKRVGQEWKGEAAAHARDVLAAAGGAGPFLAWASDHPGWRFNLAEAPGVHAGKPAALASYVVESVLDELLERRATAERKAR